MTIRRCPRWAVDGTHPEAGVRRPPCGVERGVFDVVAHGHDEIVPHRLDVHQGPTVVQVEGAVVIVLDGQAEVHELGG